MKHVILSAPLKNLTPVEQAAAQARMNMNEGGRSLAHPANMPEDEFNHL